MREALENREFTVEDDSLRQKIYNSPTQTNWAKLIGSQGSTRNPLEASGKFKDDIDAHFSLIRCRQTGIDCGFHNKIQVWDVQCIYAGTRPKQCGCSPGMYVYDNTDWGRASACLGCSPGNYDEYASHREQSCMKCPAGTYCPNVGMPAP